MSQTVLSPAMKRGLELLTVVVLMPSMGTAQNVVDSAAKYGENEGGQFCGRCFVEWSAITLPVGVGAGALVGYLIDR